MQAIRYNRANSVLLETDAMETNADRRTRKLKELAAKTDGGLAGIADRSGVSAASLDQIVKGVPLPKKKDGTRSPRRLGDRAAKAIEEGLGLGLGWFDADDSSDQPELIARSDIAPYDPGPTLHDALATVAIALRSTDNLTRIALEPLFALWAKEPDEDGSIAQRIEEFLTRRSQSARFAQDAPSSAKVARGRQQQPEFARHGASSQSMEETLEKRGRGSS